MSAHGARLARARRALISQLKAARAFTDAAAAPVEAGSGLEEKELERMIRRQVIRKGLKGGYWLDEERYADWRRRTMLFVVGLVLVSAGIMACLYLYGG